MDYVKSLNEINIAYITRAIVTNVLTLHSLESVQ